MKKIWLSAALALLGLLAIGLAVFAYQLGLDHNLAWGWSRILLLLAGVVVLLASWLPLRFNGVRDFLRIHAASLWTTFTVITITLFGLVVLAGYVWFISLGRWNSWPPTTNYYDQLARAFRLGRLNIDARIDPALLALPDPYEPDARKSIPGLEASLSKSIWDMAFYKGKVFLYWGPAPAALLAGIKLVYPVEIGDQVVTFSFVAGLFVFMMLILVEVRRRFFNRLPYWIILPAILLVGFIYPIPWILDSPRIYEAAIVSDQFFFMGGLYFAVSGLDRPSIPIWRLVLAGVFWVFAIGSRPTIGLPILFLVLIILFKLWRGSTSDSPKPFESLRLAAGLILPLAFGAIGLGWYNLARFGSVFEFGFRYEITMLNQNRLYDVLFSPLYMLPNLYLYLFNPPTAGGGFPFIKPVWNESYISNFNAIHHTIYNAERITGLVYAVPFGLFAFIPAGMLIFHLVKKRRSVGDGPDLSVVDAGVSRWLPLALVGAVLLEFLTVLSVFYGTVRYVMDVIPSLALLSILGFWQGDQLLEHRPVLRAGWVLIAVLLILITVGVSLLLAFSSDVSRIRMYNQPMLSHLTLYWNHLFYSP